jgi:hypothetical protein
MCVLDLSSIEARHGCLQNSMAGTQWSEPPLVRLPWCYLLAVGQGKEQVSDSLEDCTDLSLESQGISRPGLFPRGWLPWAPLSGGQSCMIVQ